MGYLPYQLVQDFFPSTVNSSMIMMLQRQKKTPKEVQSSKSKTATKATQTAKTKSNRSKSRENNKAKATEAKARKKQQKQQSKSSKSSRNSGINNKTKNLTKQHPTLPNKKTVAFSFLLPVSFPVGFWAGVVFFGRSWELFLPGSSS